MRFMMMVKADNNYETGVPPYPKLIAAIGKLTDDMTKAGVVLETGGLLPSSKGARVRAAGGKLTVTDGPFTEAKEVFGGYAILQARSKEEAIELGKTFMKVHADVLGPSYEGELEREHQLRALIPLRKRTDGLRAAKGVVNSKSEVAARPW